MAPIGYRTADVDGFKVFYREAGQANAPKLLLLIQQDVGVGVGVGKGWR